MLKRQGNLLRVSLPFGNAYSRLKTKVKSNVEMKIVCFTVVHV